MEKLNFQVLQNYSWYHNYWPVRRLSHHSFLKSFCHATSSIDVLQEVIEVKELVNGKDILQLELFIPITAYFFKNRCYKDFLKLIGYIAAFKEFFSTPYMRPKVFFFFFLLSRHAWWMRSSVPGLLLASWLYGPLQSCCSVNDSNIVRGTILNLFWCLKSCSYSVFRMSVLWRSTYNRFPNCHDIVSENCL